jgi:hypothetical protein
MTTNFNEPINKENQIEQKEIQNDFTDAEINAKYERLKNLFIFVNNLVKLFELETFIQKTDYHLIKKKSWNVKKQSLFIESIIMNIPYPPLVMIEINNRYEIIDGFQRIKAIDDFSQNRFQLAHLELCEELNGRTYQTLPSVVKNRLDFRGLYVCIVIETGFYDVSQEEAKHILNVSLHNKCSIH